jgi:hypothetical protein
MSFACSLLVLLTFLKFSTLFSNACLIVPIFSNTKSNLFASKSTALVLFIVSTTAHVSAGVMAVTVAVD